MNFKVIRQLLIVFLMITTTISKAQETYRAEFGPSVGSSFYIGDANSKLFVNQSLTYGLQYRHKFNSRLAVTGDWNQTKVKGSTIDNGAIINFNNPVNAFDISGEFNFFNLEDKTFKPFSQKYSTFLFTGVNAIISESNKGKPMFGSMFGVGMKLMLGKRMNLNLRWSNRLLFSDSLESIKELDNPNDLNGSNIFNNDLLSTVSVGLTFNIFKERCNCNSNW